LFYERSYTYVSTAERFDAQYFSPRMQNLIAALSQDQLTIADVAKLAHRRFKPKPGAEFRYIEIGDVTSSGTANSSPVASDEAPSRATWIVRPGDVITTTVRPIRRLSAIIRDEQNGYVCSSGFAVLTPTTIEPELLLVYLRLPLICELLDLHTTASMYPAISTSSLMKIPITLPDDPVRQRIVVKVQESFHTRREAYRLMEEAKALVDKAILQA
jgi:restriction endonuclease S subunit